jgi:uncharacterized protein YbjT (DUF2867 family)
VEITHVCVLGGSGFIGRHLCQQLTAQGYSVTVPTRNRERAKSLILLPTVDVVTANVHDPVDLAEVLRPADAVINLIGVLHDGSGPGSFRAAHVELARKVIAECRRRHCRLVHMSALNADPRGPSEYLRTKAEAEKLVADSGLDATILRPSVVFGREDRFLNLFARLLRMLPVLPLGSPGARFQPVYVEDVAAAFVFSLRDPQTIGRSYDLCGPTVYTLQELVEYVGRITGHPRPVLGLSDRLSLLQAAAMELLPIKVITRDNYYSMKVDSVCKGAFPFGIKPTPLEAVAPRWLARSGPRARYPRLRDHAGR